MNAQHRSKWLSNWKASIADNILNILFDGFSFCIWMTIWEWNDTSIFHILCLFVCCSPLPRRSWTTKQMKKYHHIQMLSAVRLYFFSIRFACCSYFMLFIVFPKLFLSNAESKSKSRKERQKTIRSVYGNKDGTIHWKQFPPTRNRKWPKRTKSELRKCNINIYITLPLLLFLLSLFYFRWMCVVYRRTHATEQTEQHFRKWKM